MIVVYIITIVMFIIINIYITSIVGIIAIFITKKVKYQCMFKDCFIIPKFKILICMSRAIVSKVNSK